MGSYYDIDAILTDAQKVPCTFDIDVPGLGYMEGNPGGEVTTTTTQLDASLICDRVDKARNET